MGEWPLFLSLQKLSLQTPLTVQCSNNSFNLTKNVGLYTIIISYIKYVEHILVIFEKKSGRVRF